MASGFCVHAAFGLTQLSDAGVLGGIEGEVN